MARLSQKSDSVPSEVKVRMVPQSTAAIDGCTLKDIHTHGHTQRTHGIDGKIEYALFFFIKGCWNTQETTEGKH